MQANEKRDAAILSVIALMADANRMRILRICETEHHVTALCEAMGYGQPAMSHHLALLRVSGMLESRREGKHNHYSRSAIGDACVEAYELIGDAAWAEKVKAE